MHLLHGAISLFAVASIVCVCDGWGGGRVEFSSCLDIVFGVTSSLAIISLRKRELID